MPPFQQLCVSAWLVFSPLPRFTFFLCRELNECIYFAVITRMPFLFNSISMCTLNVFTFSSRAFRHSFQSLCDKVENEALSRTIYNISLNYFSHRFGSKLIIQLELQQQQQSRGEIVLVFVRQHPSNERAHFQVG